MARKKNVVISAALALGLGFGALAAAPAMAATNNFGAHSCAAGTVKLTATSTGNTFMYVSAGGASKSNTYPNGAISKTNTLYSGFYASTSAQVTTPGTISSARQGCDL
ncbi:hypothetical protein CW368_00800 [Actinomycetales bacterium SN12]|nr:hypothetical protein CW368_00800 [Actinomycetales bacterium SN12]